MEPYYTAKPVGVFKLWRIYRSYMERVMQPPLPLQQAEPDYLSNRLFTQAMVYGLPTGCLALIPTVYAAITGGRSYLAFFGAITMLFVTLIAVVPHLPMAFRKAAVSAALIITAVVLTTFVGSLGIGCTYLLTFSVFYALHFADKLAKRALWINFSICLIFAAVILLRLINTKALTSVSLVDWVTYSINFLFLNVVIVVMIRQTIVRLEQTMHKEAAIHQELKAELREKQRLNDSLEESEKRYKTLFSLSPSAKLIFDIDTLQFIETNKAATEIYGHSATDFLKLKLIDIHSPEDVPQLHKHLKEGLQPDGSLTNINTRHIRKDGAFIQVEIMRSDIDFKGKRARMIVVNDITQHVAQVNAIEKQNAKLKEIAYIQSHLVRLPLTKIMALTELIADEYTGDADKQLLSALTASSNELDELIRKVVDESSTILDELGG